MTVDLGPLLGPRVPVVAAPMAGGTTTPELVCGVVEAGATAFLAAGYRTAAELGALMDRVRSRTRRPFGVNVFVPGPDDADDAALTRYAGLLSGLAARLGAAPGEPRWDDDDYHAKLDRLAAEPVAMVSFTFGCPAPGDIDRLHAAGTAVLVTVNTVEEAVLAHGAGVDALIVQGAEAGGHRGGFAEDGGSPAGAGATPLRELLPQVRAAVPLPLIAAGGMMSGLDVAAAVAAGAVAAQLGTAFLDCPEAGTAVTVRRALRDSAYPTTAFTRAFTGRSARGLMNAFMRRYGDAAPACYPHVHHLTRPLRIAAADLGDTEAVPLWAGTGWQRLRPLPAARLIDLLAEEWQAAR